MKRLRHNLSIILFYLSIIFNSSAMSNERTLETFNQRKKINLSFSFLTEIHSIDTVASTFTSAKSTSSEVFAGSVNVDYFFYNWLSFYSSFQSSLYTSNSTQVQGFKIGGKYYFLKNGPTVTAQIDGVSIDTSPHLSPFLVGSYSLKSFQTSSTSLKFVGQGFGAGVDWYVLDKHFLSAQLIYEFLENSAVRTLNIISVGLTYGIPL